MSRRFSTVLIANRGEIACRVIRTAREQGYRTVAVYSDADADALHTDIADEAIRLGPAPVNESYLNVERIFEVAQRTGAQAIHPGYGFLSENAEFAKACADNNIIFIGPPPDAIALMGNKAEAKRALLKAGVPCVPGYEGAKQDDGTLKAEAERIGFPVLLKAAAGGGGRGMRSVQSAAEMDAALAQARSESKNAFGSDELLIEKLIEHGRHVEIQVLADEHGNCIHLGERDCSVQRRHQKIVEESPCPVLTPDVREAMGEAAIKAAQAAGYTNAGTVEFLLDVDQNFYFLEMNTRLQVEHPVTEMVAGVDLVALQLAVAQGDPLPITQDDVNLRGHAIEVRLYAEDPLQNFAPQIGTVLKWEPPTGAGIRTDHGLKDGSRITPFYDAMIAKIIAWGENRDESRARLLSALHRTTVLGVGTNKDLLRSVLQHDQFAAGEAHTTFLQDTGLLEIAPKPVSAKELLLAAVAYIERDARPVPATLKGWRSTGPARVPFKLTCGDDDHALEVSMHGSAYSVTMDDETVEITVDEMTDEVLRYRWSGRECIARLAFNSDHLYIDIDDNITHFIDRTYAPAAGLEDSDDVLKAPMIGQVVQINVETGDHVEKDAVLVVLEAMKMVNHVVAPHSGTVETINVAVGDHVDTSRVLLAITPDESEEAEGQE